MICEEVIKSYLDTLREEFLCKPKPNGRLSILTPYLYPDHDNIEVFVRPKNGNEVVVSDLGETLRGLDMSGLDVMSTPNGLFAAKRIAEGFGVSIERGILVKRGPLGSVGSLIFDVISACQSIGSLIYGSRAYEPAVFKDEVTDYLNGHSVRFQPDQTETGISGSSYKIDFYIPTSNYGFWISTVSPKSNAGIQQKINRNFRMWSDLVMPSDRKISLLNDDLIPFRQEDIRILERVSTIYRWTARQSLLEVLLGGPPVGSETKT